MSQLITKFIADNAVTDIKQYLRNNLPQRARNAADSDTFSASNGDIEIIVTKSATDITKFQLLNSFRIVEKIC